jgi:hypothetical protein
LNSLPWDRSTGSLQSHGWDTPSPSESCDEKTAPLPVDTVDPFLQISPWTNEGYIRTYLPHCVTWVLLTVSHGFSYLTLLGERLYSYITFRPDVGYAVVALSKFGSAHSSFHISCPKNVAKYLRRTKHWGIRFTCRVCDSSLIPGEPYGIRLDSNLPSFPAASHTLQLTVFVDAPHANDLRNRRSTTGYAFLLSDGAVAYRSKTQTVTATSSPEAELLAAITAAKTAKYLRQFYLGLDSCSHHPLPSILITSQRSRLSMPTVLPNAPPH